MFLIRTAFWLTLVILLLPTNEQDQRNVYGTAEAAVNDFKSFCTRNPGVCEKSGEALDLFAQKAQFGAKMLMNFVSDATSEQAIAAKTEEKSRRFPVFLRRDSQNTLTNDDVEPAWSGPSSNEGI
jgi:hypothetical protein